MKVISEKSSFHRSSDSDAKNVQMVRVMWLMMNGTNDNSVDDERELSRVSGGCLASDA